MPQHHHHQSNSERRKHPRLAGNIPVKLCAEEFDIVTETKNLSRTGAYCRVNKYIEPMTKMKIQLLLPFKQNTKTLTKKVSCQGVVVRAEAVPGGENFNIAIYFNEIKTRDADYISEFVHTALDQGATQT